MRLLIFEDDEKTASALASGLQVECYAVGLARSGEEALSNLKAQSVDLMVLDWMLPGRDGIEVLKVLRASGKTTPVRVGAGEAVVGGCTAHVGRGGSPGQRGIRKTESGRSSLRQT